MLAAQELKQDRPIEMAVLVQELRAHLAQRQVELPMLPGAALRVYRQCRAPDADLDAIVGSIETDQRLAGEVVRVANSAWYAPVFKTRSLSQALTRIGLKRLAELAFTAAVSTSVFRGATFRCQMSELWRMSLASALWGRAIASNQRADAEIGFLSGLLQSIGDPGALGVIAKAPQLDIGDLAPRQVNTLMHALSPYVGPRLATVWKLPPVLRACVHSYAGRPFESSASAWVERARAARELAVFTLHVGVPDPDLAACGPAVSRCLDTVAVKTLVHGQGRRICDELAARVTV